jgi:hypothetical protein
MYRITTPSGETHLTEKITYVRQHSSGVFLITDQKRAKGVGYRGNFYLFSDGAQVHEVDGGDEFKSVRKDANAMKAQLQQADDTVIELFEANLAQEEINAAQDDTLIELYEMIGG